MTDEEIANIYYSEDPQDLGTANGVVTVDRMVPVWIHDLAIRVMAYILKNCPSVLSCGKLCYDHDFEYHCIGKKQPYVQKGNLTILCDLESNVPVLMAAKTKVTGNSAGSKDPASDSSIVAPDATVANTTVATEAAVEPPPAVQVQPTKKKRKRKARGKKDAPEENSVAVEKKPKAGTPGWVTTFADLMSLLMCFFVMLLGFPAVELGPTAADARWHVLRADDGVRKLLRMWKRRFSDEAEDLLAKMLTVDPEQRITAAQALQHPFVIA